MVTEPNISTRIDEATYEQLKRLADQRTSNGKRKTKPYSFGKTKRL